MTDPTLNPAHCECKYCGGVKYQRQINLRDNLPGPTAEIRSSPELGGSSTQPSGRSARRAAVDRTRPSSPALVFNPVNPEHESDTRTQRPYRAGEIVWVVLDPPIPLDSTTDGVVARYWPGVVVEHRVHPTVETHEPGRPFGVTQTPMYRVGMLVVTAEYVLPESSLLPFIAYRTSDTINRFLTKYVEDMKAQQDMCHQLLAENWYRAVEPLPNPLRTSASLLRSEELSKSGHGQSTSPSGVLMAYTIALRMSRTAAHHWCATDEFLFTIQHAEDQDPEQQTRFQGLLWGPERIWTGDLARLRLTRPRIAGQFLPSSPGAESRGLFLKIEALYLDPQIDADGQQIAPRHMMSGSLFELAPANFEDQSNQEPRGLVNLSVHQLPRPPPGYKFRSITPSAEFDAHFEIRHLAGRYYPHLINASNIVLDDDVSQTISRNIPRLLGIEDPEGCAIKTNLYMFGRPTMLVTSELQAIKKIFPNYRVPEFQFPGSPTGVSVAVSNAPNTLISGISGQVPDSPSRFPMLASMSSPR